MESIPILIAKAAAVAELGLCAADFAALDDATLLVAQHRHSELRHQVDTHGVWIAAEIARRSTRELGYAGLAQRQGFFSPEDLIQSMSKATRSEAAKLVRVGTLLAEIDAVEQLAAIEAGQALGAGDPSFRAGGDPAGVDPPPATSSVFGLSWHASIAHAVASGSLPLDSAEPIRTILGEVAERVPFEVLRDACERLVADAETRNADQMYRRARQVRDQIDEAGISGREARQYDDRSLRVWERRDGMIQANVVAHPEEGQALLAWYHDALGPRRGGPRLANPTAQEAARRLLDDPRTNEQIAADTFFDLFRAALEINPATMVAHRRPTVRVIVNDHALRAAVGATPAANAPADHAPEPIDPPGHGRIEGVLDAVSMATIQRYLCDAGTVAVGFDDDGQCVNVGRDQRLFTSKQRIGLAVEGRRLHVRPLWQTTRLLRGPPHQLLAPGPRRDERRRRNLVVPTTSPPRPQQRIIRDGATYSLIPPRQIDPAQAPIRLRSKNPDMWDLNSDSAVTHSQEPAAGHRG